MEGSGVKWNYQRAISIARRREAGEKFTAMAIEMGVTPTTIRAAYLDVCRRRKAGETLDQMEKRLGSIPPTIVSRTEAILRQTRKRLESLRSREARLVAQLEELGFPEPSSKEKGSL